MYVPPVLVKPEDTIDPRIGPEFQVTDIPEAVEYIPSSNPSSTEIIRSSYHHQRKRNTVFIGNSSSLCDRMVCLHKAAIPSTETAHRPSLYDILLDEVSNRRETVYAKIFSLDACFLQFGLHRVSYVFRFYIPSYHQIIFSIIGNILINPYIFNI